MLVAALANSPPDRPARTRRWTRIACAAAWLACWAAPAAAAENRDWTLGPYQVQCLLAVDAAARPQPGLEVRLARALAERAEAVLAPLWQMELAIAAAPADRRQCFNPVERAWDELPAAQRAADKHYSLGVRVVEGGYELTCREFDVYLRRWGPVRRHTIAQASFLEHSCFNLLLATFAPLATIEPLADDDQHVRLVFKGSGLPVRRVAADAFTQSGDAFQPLLRRTDRTGELLKNGITPIPWTYLTIAEPAGPAPSGEQVATAPSATTPRDWTAAIHTGVRRPFGVQRRGFVHQVAIALRNDRGPTQVRFHARSDPEQGLAGYEVFRSRDDGPAELIGSTDRQGLVTIPPGAGSVTTVLVRSDGQLLAKIPVPAGQPTPIQTPIADNLARLRAQAESQVVREELIDVVARRAVMTARVRSLLKKGRVDEARQLMMELDELPNQSAFGRNIEQAAKRIPPAGDPAVQQKIDRLFSSTRELLSKFLSSRPISELQSEVNAAAPGGS